MNFLRQIEGCKEERMSSELLRYLLINSDQFRNRFAGYLSEKAGLSLPERVTFENGIICMTECTTESAREHKSDAGPATQTDGVKKGRVDLSVESDGHIIFIENKLWADFQPDQPRKYLNSLRARGGETDKRQLMVVLFPQFRTDLGDKIDGFQGELAQDKGIETAKLHWNDIVAIAEKVSRLPNSPEIQVILGMFIDYLNEKLWNKVDMPTDFQVFLSPVRDKKANLFQEKLVRSLRVVLERYGTKVLKVRSGASWMGFYFTFANEPEGAWNWLGFLNHREGTHEEALLVLQRSFNDKSRPVELPGKGLPIRRLDRGSPTTSTYKIKFCKGWDTLLEWQGRLKPILDALRKC